MTAGARLTAVVAAGIVPWVVVQSGSTVSFVTSFGLVIPGMPHLTTVWAYVFVHTQGLPASLVAWPVATLLYAFALAGATIALVSGHEDRRLTGGLLVFAGTSLIPVALGVGRPAGVVAVPTGTAGLWLVAWWGYGDALTRVVRRSPTRSGR